MANAPNSALERRRTAVAKPEWGAKRVCQACGTKFYDLKRDPIVCPSCSAEFDPEALLRSRRTTKPQPTPKVVAAKKVSPEVEDEEKRETEEEELEEIEDLEEAEEELKEEPEDELSGDEEEEEEEDEDLIEDASELGEDDDLDVQVTDDDEDDR
jgi:uncharacterized protein (TIGR02300 family)